MENKKKERKRSHKAIKEREIKSEMKYALMFHQVRGLLFYISEGNF